MVEIETGGVASKPAGVTRSCGTGKLVSSVVTAPDSIAFDADVGLEPHGLYCFPRYDFKGTGTDAAGEPVATGAHQQTPFDLLFGAMSGSKPLIAA